MQLTDLIERLEKVTGPDYSLGQDIGRVLNLRQRYEHPGSLNESWPNYTGSLDAAMTLLPESQAFLMGRTHQRLYWVEMPGPLASNQFRGGSAISLPIALCIAALKARSAFITQAIPEEK
jgi:hypothetical protein